MNEKLKNILNSKIDSIESSYEENLKGNLIQINKENFIKIISPLNLHKSFSDLSKLKSEGFDSIAICLLHSYTFSYHEELLEQIALHLKFSNVSTSSKLFPRIGFIKRGNAALLDAYLNPIIQKYIHNFLSGFSSKDLGKK